MKPRPLCVAALAATMISVPSLPALAVDNNAMLLATIACASLQSHDRAITCQVEYPNGGPALMLKFRNQAQAIGYGPMAVALFGETVCSALKSEGDDEDSEFRLALVDLSSGSANVYSCAKRTFKGWLPLNAAFR
jgi:hypothetical protein